MTPDDHDGIDEDTAAVEAKYGSTYGPESIGNAIESMKRIGYTLVAPFIKERHLSICDGITGSYREVRGLEGELGADDHEEVIGLCVLALSKPKAAKLVMEIVRERRLTAPAEVEKLLEVMRKTSEPLHTRHRY